MQRTTPEMLERIQCSGNPIKIDVSSADFVLATSNSGAYAARKPIAISSTGGNVIYVDILDDYGNTITDVIIPANTKTPFFIQNVTKIKKTGTDGTNIVLWTL